MQLLELFEIVLLAALTISIFLIGRLYKEKYAIKESYRDFIPITTISEVIFANTNSSTKDEKTLDLIKTVIFNDISAKLNLDKEIERIPFKEIENRLGKSFSKRLKLLLLDLSIKTNMDRKEIEKLIVKYLELKHGINERN